MTASYGSLGDEALSAAVRTFQAKVAHLGPAKQDEEVAALLRAIEAETRELQALRYASRQAQQSGCKQQSQEAAASEPIEKLLKQGKVRDAEQLLATSHQSSKDATAWGALLRIMQGEVEEARKLLSSSNQADTARAATDTQLSLVTHLRSLLTRLDGLTTQESVSSVTEWAGHHLPYPGVKECITLQYNTMLLASKDTVEEGIKGLQNLLTHCTTHPPSRLLHHTLWHLSTALLTTHSPEQAFTHLRRLQTLNPRYPGLQPALQRAARAALQRQQEQGEDQGQCDSDSVGGGSEDCYAVLGVRRGASLAEVQRAYRAKALELHPDRFPDPDAKVAATVGFQALTRALQEIQERIENGYVQA